MTSFQILKSMWTNQRFRIFSLRHARLRAPPQVFFQITGESPERARETDPSKKYTKTRTLKQHPKIPTLSKFATGVRLRPPVACLRITNGACFHVPVRLNYISQSKPLLCLADNSMLHVFLLRQSSDHCVVSG